MQCRDCEFFCGPCPSERCRLRGGWVLRVTVWLIGLLKGGAR